MQQTQRIVFLDYLRVIACFMVILVHSVGINDDRVRRDLHSIRQLYSMAIRIGLCYCNLSAPEKQNAPEM